MLVIVGSEVRLDSAAFDCFFDEERVVGPSYSSAEVVSLDIVSFLNN